MTDQSFSGRVAQAGQLGGDDDDGRCLAPRQQDRVERRFADRGRCALADERAGRARGLTRNPDVERHASNRAHAAQHRLIAQQFDELAHQILVLDQRTGPGGIARGAGVDSGAQNEVDLRGVLPHLAEALGLHQVALRHGQSHRVAREPGALRQVAPNRNRGAGDVDAGAGRTASIGGDRRGALDHRLLVGLQALDVRVDALDLAAEGVVFLGLRDVERAAFVGSLGHDRVHALGCGLAAGVELRQLFSDLHGVAFRG